MSLEQVQIRIETADFQSSSGQCNTETSCYRSVPSCAVSLLARYTKDGQDLFDAYLIQVISHLNLVLKEFIYKELI